MHTTTRRKNRAIARRAVVAGATLMVGTMVDSSPIGAISADATAAITLHDAHHQEPEIGPRLLHGAIAEALVRVGGGAVCSGTPIAGTVYVVTAAHCVLDREGNAAARTVVRDGVTYSTRAVLVDDRYFD